ncbi:PSP1 C-terminal conserved region-domain-containing protein [Chlamydoabsidia padenii]|nr:PSP1 C-terminal conserved region-domain-containing protein [Chlamydoabsidia padenii]
MTSLVDSIDELTKPQPTSTDIEPPTVLPIPSTAAASTTITSTGAKDLYAKVAAAGLTDATTTRPPSQHQDSQVDSTAPSSSSSSLTTTTIAVSAATTTCPYYTLPKSDDMGKGIKMESIPKDASYYVVEFKAGRTDIYFSPLMVKVGDLVMVEADRGHDLGKVVVDAMTPSQLLNYTQQQQQEDLVEQDTKSTLQQRGDLRIKRLFRLARPEEITQLVSKSEDELKALSTCQARVQQRKLNISVVNAEFQMDRRKLIFYFIAEKRVDFRELVRDLFKVYKTRIWM